MAKKKIPRNINIEDLKSEFNDSLHAIDMLRRYENNELTTQEFNEAKKNNHFLSEERLEDTRRMSELLDKCVKLVSEVDKLYKENGIHVDREKVMSYYKNKYEQDN